MIRRAELLAAGVHTRRLSSSEFLRVFSGYYTKADAPASLTEMCRVVQQEILDGAAISHTTAAVHQGIPLPTQLENGVGMLAAGATWGPTGRIVPSMLTSESVLDPFADLDGVHSTELPTVHVTRPDGTSGKGTGFISHRRSPGPTIELGGLVLSHPLEVLCQLAPILPLWDLVAAIDNLIGPKALYPGLDLADVARYVENQRDRAGIHRLRGAVTLARENVESLGETHARLLVRLAGFDEPTPNVIVRIPATGRHRRVDGGWEELKVGFEYDGGWRRTDRKAWRRDEARRDDLMSAGWTQRRLNHADRLDPVPFLLKLRATLEPLGARVPSVSRIRGIGKVLDTHRPSLLYGPRTARAQ